MVDDETPEEEVIRLALARGDLQLWEVRTFSDNTPWRAPVDPTASLNQTDSDSDSEQEE